MMPSDAARRASARLGFAGLPASPVRGLGTPPACRWSHIPSGALRSEEEATALGSLAFPYPTSLGVDMLGLALSGMPDMSAFEERISALEARWAALSGDEAKPA